MRALLIVALLVGCAGHVQDGDLRMGDTVSQPDGYRDLCNRTPDVPECGGGK